jgi:hypothetical protein
LLEQPFLRTNVNLLSCTVSASCHVCSTSVSHVTGNLQILKFFSTQSHVNFDYIFVTQNGWKLVKNTTFTTHFGVLQPGTDVMIFFNFSLKNSAKNWRFCLKTKLVFAKIVIITLVFEKNANFFAEIWQKSQKIVIITSTPGWPDWANFFTLVNLLLWTVFLKNREVHVPVHIFV